MPCANLLSLLQMKHARILFLLSLLLISAKYCASSYDIPPGSSSKAEISIKRQFAGDLGGYELAHDIWNNNGAGNAYHLAGKQKPGSGTLGTGYPGYIYRLAGAAGFAERLAGHSAIATRHKNTLLFPMHSFL